MRRLSARHNCPWKNGWMNQGKPIGPNDTLIAATARAHDATLITHNIGEFSRVAGLQTEDWEIA